MKFLLCFLLAALASWVAWSEEESVWRLFYAPGGDCEQARQIVHPLLEKGARLVLQELPARAETREAILLQSEAIDAGVRSLPCLVLPVQEVIALCSCDHTSRPILTGKPAGGQRTRLCPGSRHSRSTTPPRFSDFFPHDPCTLLLCSGGSASQFHRKPGGTRPAQ